jgi:hypothetical protein
MTTVEVVFKGSHIKKFLGKGYNHFSAELPCPYIEIRH